MHKRFISSLLLSTLMFITSSSLIKANSGEISNPSNDLKEATEVVNYYISKSTELGDNFWNGFKITGSHKIYDNQLEEYGYVFNLNSGKNEGYAIVTCEDNVCSVVEASYDSASPFEDYENTHYLVYCSPLEYLVTEKSKFKSNNVLVKNIETNETAFIDGSKKVRFINEMAVTRSVPGETIRYISQYQTKFNAINQNKSYNCVATSMAMCLKYLQNIGTIGINISNNNNPSVKLIRDKITSYYNGNNGSDANVRGAINRFGREFCSPKISTRGDGFWGNSPQTDITFQTIINEINSNCPLVMMFNPGRVDSGINVNHATACVGYKTLNNTSTGGVTFNYTIVRMPNVASEGNEYNNIATKQVAWNYNNVHGYYLVYIG